MELIPDLTRTVEADAVEVAANATPLDFLEAVYRSPAQPMPRRIRAAVEALPFVHPKLAVTALIDGEGLAARLERAIARSGKVIEHGEPLAVEHQAVNQD